MRTEGIFLGTLNFKLHTLSQDLYTLLYNNNDLQLYDKFNVSNIYFRLSLYKYNIFSHFHMIPLALLSIIFFSF